MQKNDTATEAVRNTEKHTVAGPSYYAYFLQQLGLRKKPNTEEDLLIPEEKNKIPSIKQVAGLMQQIRTRENATSSEMISLLEEALGKIDRTDDLRQNIHAYLCRQAVKQTVLQRFNETIGCTCSTPSDLSAKICDSIVEANALFNTLRFCDPSTGTGHLMVALLNELIAFKSQLGILTDRNGNPLFRYRIQSDGYELLVFDKKRYERCSLNASDPEMRSIREAIGDEKRILIERCLFGADRNPASVALCRLRLWLSYLKQGSGEAKQSFLASAVECNFRCGDAAVSRYPIQEDLKKVFKRTGYSLSEYKNATQQYKTVQGNEKEQLGQWIAAVRRELERGVAPAYKQAVEWRYEFPELWNDAGDFTGFDLLIGSPESGETRTNEPVDFYKSLNSILYKPGGDRSLLFYELGNRLLKPDGFMYYFISNGWTKSVSSRKVRQYLMEETNPLLMIHFDSIDGGILALQKARNQYRMKSGLIGTDFDGRNTNPEDYLQQKATQPSDAETKPMDADSIGFGILSGTEKSIKEKLEQTGTPLDAWDIKIYSGIKTGCNEAFIINGKMKDDFILADYKNIDVIKPLLLEKDIRRYVSEPSDGWLICIPWHFPLLYDSSIKMASERAEIRFRQQYAVLYAHLVKYKEKLVARNTAEVGVVFEWYTLQSFSATNEWDDFAQQKIVWQRNAGGYNFCLDYSGCAVLDTTCFITGQHLKYLLGVLNSKLGRYMLCDSYNPSGGNVQNRYFNTEAVRIPLPNIKIESEMISLVNKRTSDVHRSEIERINRKIDEYVYEIYELNEKEQAFIETNIT